MKQFLPFLEELPPLQDDERAIAVIFVYLKKDGDIIVRTAIPEDAGPIVKYATGERVIQAMMTLERIAMNDVCCEVELFRDLAPITADSSGIVQ